MRKVTFLLIAALAAAAPLSQPVLAQDKAAEVLASVRKALGDGKLDSLKTFSFEAKTARNMGERQLLTDSEFYLDLPDKYLRVDNITAPIARTMTMGFNGAKVIRPAGGMAGGPGMVIMNGMPMGDGGGRGGGGQRMTMEVVAAGGGAPPPPGGAAPNVTPEMVDAGIIRSQRLELSRMMLGWFGTAHPAINATYTYGGEAESPDGKAHIINIKADGGFEAKLFVDQATNIPLMVTWQALEPLRLQNMNTPGQPAPTREEMQARIEEARKNLKLIEFRVYFGDWQEVDGIKFPHTLQRATGSTTTEEWTISKVKVNPKIDAKKFQ